jgi:DNA primase
MRETLENACGEPKSLLDYLQEQGWKPVRDAGREEVCGLCPLHTETRPSFYVNRRKQVFYCHGCGQGGDGIRLVELLEGVGFAQARARLRPAAPAAGLLERTYRFYQAQLAGCDSAQRYLACRGIRSRELIAQMRIGYAPGACLRSHLEEAGYDRQCMREAGLINKQGRDCFFGCITFPLPGAGNLYGRSITNGWPHRFLPGSKGGLYGWSRAQAFPSLILVEGLFDLAALWQAGFLQAVAALGSHLNSTQWAQLSTASSRTIYLCLDADGNGSGPRAARQLGMRLTEAGLEARRVELPCGHDPNSFFAAGADAAEFQRYLDRARP